MKCCIACLIVLLMISPMVLMLDGSLAFAEDAPEVPKDNPAVTNDQSETPTDRPTVPNEATAKTLDGKVVSLADHKGKLVFLVVWKTDCPACLIEIPILNKLQEEYSSEDFTIIGLSMDRGKDDFVKKVVEVRKIDYPVWLGYNEPISRYLSTPLLPTLFVIGPEGEVLGYLIGPFRSYEHAVANVKHARSFLKEKEGSE